MLEPQQSKNSINALRQGVVTAMGVLIKWESGFSWSEEEGTNYEKGEN